MKKSYKVEITRTAAYVVAVAASSEGEAHAKATEAWSQICAQGTEHYHAHGDPVEEITAVFDVTGTDDAPEEN